MPQKNYDYIDYTPDMSSLHDLPKAEEYSQAEEAARRRSQGRRVRQARREKVKPQVMATPEPKGESWWTRFKNAMTGTSARMLGGIFLGCLGIYLLVSFLSYFVSCVEDQSLINSMPVGTVKNIANQGGEGGARLSEFLINESFGLGSFVIIVWLLALSFKMLVGKPKFKVVDFTIRCFIVLITVSLIIGLITIGASTPVNWGGYHGRYVNEFIISFVGWTGAALLSLFMLSVFVTLCLRDVVKWVMRKRAIYKEKRRRIAAEKAEREAREEEIRRMQAQEQIDDIKAGETTSLNPESVAEITDDTTQVDFSGEDAPLYEVEPDSDLKEEKKGEAEVDKVDDVKDVADNQPVTELNDTQADITEAAETTEDDKESESIAASPKMKVNVNSIGQADTKRPRSIIDIYESQNYKFPPFELLRPAKEKKVVDEEEQLENKEKIRKTLMDFGIPIVSIEATIGPTVTLYEIVPENGVKISKIRGLVDDIALSLSAIGVRIIAPIPGKGTVGIEVANKDPETVSMRTVIRSNKFQESKYHLPVALGSTISNDVYIADLCKMPHLLVAGATGQGKSVGLNAIIASLLYSKAPWQLKFVMIDPKQVEFSLYNKIRDYYMAVIPGQEDEEPVITDMQRVEATLNSLVIEMEERYSLLKAAHTRNIEEYNAKIRDCLLNPEEGHKFLPYIVVVVDEFGDLIMASGKVVEMPIARLAQKARAVGMHVIIATQRPSTNVITGIIKANFPARISFKVSSGVDSKTILDTPGAQQLIGRGDMLIFNNSEMVRVQCAFIDTPEVEALCDYVAKQPYPTGPYMLPEPVMADQGESRGGEFAPRERDPLFEEVARMVVSKNQASTSSIQRLYSLGYTRAGRIMDQLEQAHIVGPNQGGKPRAVLVDPMELENILASL